MREVVSVTKSMFTGFPGTAEEETHIPILMQDI